MRIYLFVVSLILLTISPAMSEDSNVNSEFLKVMSELTDALKKIKDKASAEEYLPKLKALEVKLIGVTKARPKFTAEEQKNLSEIVNAGKMEMSRLELMPEVRALLIKQSDFFQAGVKSNRLTAETQIRIISYAMEAYRSQHDKYPENLKALTEGDKPSLKPSANAFIDPWNKPIQFDLNGPKHHGKKPDVWTVSPDKEVLGNWEEDQK